MAQAIALTNDVRHKFSKTSVFIPSSDGTVGRITGICVTKQNNILMCDNKKNQLILFDQYGGYLESLHLDGSPWDVTITDDNVAFVTLPNKQTVLIADPDRLCISSTFVSPDPNITIFCVSTGGSATILVNHPLECYIYLGCNTFGRSCSAIASDGYISEGNLSCSTDLSSKRVVKYCVYTKNKRKLDDYIHFYCAIGQNHVGRRSSNLHAKETFITSPTLLGPSDLCFDDYGHIYVSGQYSHNIYRLNEDGSVVDIPLSDQHGIKYPVALCFDQKLTKLYIVNNWGKEVLIFDVI